MLRLLLLFFSLVSVARGESMGVAFYAMQGFSRAQCTTALRAFRGVDTPALSILWRSFGNRDQCLKRYLTRFAGRRHVLMVHITNQTCTRNGRTCQSGETRLVKRSYAVRDFWRAHAKAGAELWVTPALEDGWNNEEAKHANYIVREIVHPALLVRNPVFSSNAIRDSANYDAIELHSKNANFNRVKCIWNNDGYDIDFSGGYRALNGALSTHDIFRYARKYANRCDVFLWWNTQGINSNKFILPSRRDFTIRSRDISLVNQFIRSNQ